MRMKLLQWTEDVVKATYNLREELTTTNVIDKYCNNYFEEVSTKDGYKLSAMTCQPSLTNIICFLNPILSPEKPS